MGRGLGLLETETASTRIADKARLIADAIETVVIGKREIVELALTAILVEGHVLIEDIPGVGKTTLAKSLAKTLGCVFKRIQFTPDLLPADITGTGVFNQKDSQFEFREGPVFANVVLADEINRATPKTQSSLLECMEEGQITSDGITYQLPHPFFVIATQNHIEAHGTYPLPEAQMDRFLMRISIGYPERDEEVRILSRPSQGSPVDRMESVITRDELLALQAEVANVYIDPSLREYVVDIVAATRKHPMTQFGASPRGSLFLLHAAQAYAGLKGRTYVLPDDVKRLAKPVLAHRIILRPEARAKGTTAETMIGEILSQIPVPATM